ncbi:MAG: UDP-N-acetylmuramoyl-L-alanyl-D-glutamate--2,6-diaminopimelate ligase [Actinomycetota bacterium]|nr:UDP-N-acetylmuramoyl-L-alanyl-D-glutamate--2,6-diaminopimelate ligase [Actinomycetota bacterium]
MRLDRLLAHVEVLDRRGDLAAVEVSALSHDSRRAGPGALFFCLPGAHADGHDHAPAAVEAGAAALVVERFLPLGVPQVRVADTRAAMAPAAAAFHGHPSDALRVAGVTGTNGKTTTTHLLAAVLEAHGWPTEVVGTLGGVRTTPESPELQARLAAALAAGRRAAALEVSSHAMVQHRVDAVRFAVVAFTNLGRDHLDYHGDMESYFSAKAALFETERAACGVVNADDPYGRRLLETAPIPVRAYRLSDAPDLEVGPGGTTFAWEGERVRLALGGRFNASNALCAATMARELGVPARAVADGLSSVEAVPGRYERVDAGQPFAVVVDYAHTPDALAEVLDAAREEAGPGRVLVVFGCGGDRDRTKRPLMGEVAAALADLAVLTSDNPRGEEPLAIIDEVRAGVRAGDRLRVEPDRQAAIELALGLAGPGDVVLIAGKGHETGQALAGRTVPFDDRQAARKALQRRSEGAA